MHKIGFVKKSGRHFIHPECKHLFVEFPPGIVEIGDDHNITPDEINVSGTKIKILSPTDCVKDRLASYIYFKSRDCLDQALLVAHEQPISWDKVLK